MRIFCIIIIGFLLRLIISKFGFNFDFKVWQSYPLLFDSGKNIYEGTLTYGPIWVFLTKLIEVIPFPNIGSELIPGGSYRLKIIIFLGLVDIFIFLILSNKFSTKVASIYYLNPITIIVTGFHNQINNIPILLGFISMIIFEYNKFNKKNFLALCLLGLSLSVKHILYIFPIWLFFKENNKINKFFILLIPYLIFIVTLTPYLIDNYKLVIFKLFEYGKFENGPFWKIFISGLIFKYLNIHFLFSILIICIGLLINKKNTLELYFIYLISIVTLSSQWYIQYLFIPIISLAYFWNKKFLIFTITTTILFCLDPDELNLTKYLDGYSWSYKNTRVFYYPIFLILFYSYIEILFGKKINKKFIKIFKNLKKNFLKQII